MTQKMQIAILGGGIGALTAAFELTEQDPKNERYDITVYTLGWRLGGKCLVGRDEQRDWRALEHGLHVWAGFYDNTFDLVQRLYARLERSPNEWRGKFEGLNHFTVMEFFNGSWKPWPLQARPNSRCPGIDPDCGLAPLTVLINLLQWVEQSSSILCSRALRIRAPEQACGGRLPRRWRRPKTTALQRRFPRSEHC